MLRSFLNHRLLAWLQGERCLFAGAWCKFGQMRAEKLFFNLCPMYLKKDVPRAAGIGYSVRLRVSDYGFRGTLHSKQEFYWETPVDIALFYRGTMIAVIGVHFVHGSAIIKQLQGVIGQAKPLLSTFKWERLLVRLVLELLKNLEFKGPIKMFPASKSFSFGRLEEYSPEYCSRLQRYNGTAKRMGFRYEAASDMFVFKG